MFSLLLAIIYLAFISLGLPDSLLGAGWPVMQPSLGVPLSYAGIVSMTIAGGTIISSLLSDRLTKKLGAGLVTAISVMATAVALLGFSFSGAFWMLCVFAVPYGLGAGAVDAALNNYVALHYKSQHMNWLHCFWGVGAAISPYIMGYYLTSGAGWEGGYRMVSYLQIGLTAILFFSLPLWKKRNSGPMGAVAASDSAAQGENAAQGDADGNIAAPNPDAKPMRMSQILQIRGVKFILPAFFGYCALEGTAGLWASSYLVIQRGIDVETAARYASFFYLGITAGRFLSGFISDRIGDKNMLRIGITVTVLGIVAIWLPIPSDILCLNGLIVAGLGSAPIYPAIIHATPGNFGKENSQAVIGVQMASAYLGMTFMPPLFGIIANNVSISLYPIYLLALAALMLFMSEKLNRLLGRLGIRD